ncbi:GlyGly-CTERM sorting domain-containing protein [Gallaecimonas sp. GXIMD4217]|uniref:GlyGly-CTERM sorting domain-containing protein n=1 Tax=Gallaecimonas sp. GXIMD4217 TaxID=3131927 RepID=UPI00311ACF65
MSGSTTQLPDAQEGDVYYAMVGLGSDAYNSDNLGDMAVKLQHMGGDTQIEASQTAAKAGDRVDFTVTLAPNLLGGEREFSLSTTLAEGLQLLEDSVVVGGIGSYGEDLTVDGNVIRIDSAQPSSLGMKRHYVFTDNLTDATCKVPYGDDPAFYDLASEGYAHMGISGRSNQVLYIPLAASGLPHVPLYANPEMYGQDVLGISPFGYLQFDMMPEFFNFHYPFTDVFQSFPDTMVAPLWRGDVMMPEASFDWSSGRWNNVVYGIITGKHYVFQWDGGQEWRHFLINSNPDPDARFNAETIVATDIDFAEGTPEIIFAYKTLQSANGHIGSVGLHGYNGERGTFAPQGGWLNDGVAYNDVDEHVQEGMVICADYRGPEQSALTLSFSARVSANAVGLDNAVTVDSQFADSELVTVSHVLSAPSNIQLAALSDQEMDENGTLEGLVVHYNDVKGTANGIKVEGEHISATVQGSESGSTFAITPEAHWHGSTEVTVTVFDLAYPSDAASTSFMLTVHSDGVDPITPDPEPKPQPEQGSGGGSFGWLMALALGLAGLRRRPR